MKKLLVITGPTATGKTALGVEACQRLNGEVVSADSMQLYKELNIGTAKPTAEEMGGIPHHMTDVISPFENYSAARYAKEAGAVCDELLSRGKLPVIVGGTGLYIDALIKGTEFAEDGDGTVRERLCAEYDEIGGEAMLRRLAENDPERAAVLHANDKKRIVRALEIYELTGMSITRHDELSRQLPPRFETVKIALVYNDRATLYGRIDRRVDIMMECGLFDEVKGLAEAGLNESHTAMQAIGYKELLAVLRGSVSMEEAVDTIKRESRRYAKRQLSWLRRDKEIHYIAKDDPENADSISVLERIYSEENT